MAGWPVTGLSVVSSTAISGRAASRNASIDLAAGPKRGASGKPCGSIAVPWRAVWIPLTAKKRGKGAADIAVSDESEAQGLLSQARHAENARHATQVAGWR